MKVAYIHGNSHILAGQEIVLMNMVSGLTKKGVQIIVVLPQDGIFAKTLKDQGAQVKFIGLARFEIKNPFLFLRCVFQLFIFAKRERISIFHTSGAFPNQYCVIAAKLAGIKCICHVQTTAYSKERIQDSLLAWSDKTIAVSKGVQEMLKEAGIKGSEIQIVYNGSAPDELSQSINKTAGLKESLGIPSSSKIIGQVGQIIERKGIEDFIRMAKVLVDQKYDIRFLLVGDDKNQRGYMDSMKSLAKSLGVEKYIVFAGFKNNPIDFLSIMDVVVLCSLAEGFSMALIEAAFLEKPIVSTNIPGSNECIDDGINGFLVPPKDPVALAGKISFLLDNPQTINAFVLNAKKKANKMFTLESQIDQIFNIYKNFSYA